MSLRTWWREHRQRVAANREPDPIWTPPTDPRWADARYQVPPPQPGPIYGVQLDTRQPARVPDIWARMPVATEPFKLGDN
jgi:hypothetical protein